MIQDITVSGPDCVSWSKSKDELHIIPSTAPASAGTMMILIADGDFLLDTKDDQENCGNTQFLASEEIRDVCLDGEGPEVSINAGMRPTQFQKKGGQDVRDGVGRML